MLEYDSKNYDPPAPIAYVTLRNPQNGTVIPNVPLLVDTGADATLLPLSAVRQLGVEIEVDSEFEVQVFVRAGARVRGLLLLRGNGPLAGSGPCLVF